VIYAILLAAGESTRMGQPKQILPWAGTTLIEWQIAQLREAGASRVIAVLGSRAEDIEVKASASGGEVVINEDYRSGRASSLRAGAAAISDDASCIVILSVDQPRPSWISRLLVERWEETSSRIVTPRFGERGGHPVVLDASLLPELRRVEEANLGLRAITEKYRHETTRVLIDNACVIVDLNTPGEYESALSAFNRGDWEQRQA
jgi:molybdenum cofactor cytidylyltransferase